VIIALVNDIFFVDLIRLTADQLGADCLVMDEEEPLQAALQEETPDVLFLDANLSTLDGSSLIRRLKQNPSTRAIPIIVYGNSLRADLLQDAQESGADVVLPKSAFKQQLAGLIRHYSKPR